MADDRKSGKASFIAPDGNENEAYFDSEVYYDFKEDRGVDDVINIDVKPDDMYGYKATLIWIGSKPDEKAMTKVTLFSLKFLNII